MKPLMLFISLLFPLTVCGQIVCNPVQYGLYDADTPLEKYEVLLKTHKDALAKGARISYEGIDDIYLEIPKNFEEIPVPENTDFASVRLHVKNNSKDVYLFTMIDATNPVSISKEQIDKGEYSEIGIPDGLCLLELYDTNLWVEERKGYGYGVNRKDMLLLKDCVAQNDPVFSYTSESTSPTAWYRPVSETTKIFSNISFERVVGSTFKTNLLKVKNQYKLIIRNVSISTPVGSGLTADECITVQNSVDITLENVRIEGTYSKKDKFGYGLSLDCIYDLKVTDLYARAEWGVFGCNNLNRVTLTNCDINRFDIHCYGRDVLCEDCNFVGLYNQFSSLYGFLIFENCTFSSFTPVLIESSYNSYTGFDIIWKDCVFNLDRDHYYLVNLLGLEASCNTRPELSRKCLPNVSLVNCTINLSDGLKEWGIFKTGAVDYEDSLDHISKIILKDITVSRTTSVMKMFSQPVRTTNNVRTIVRRMKIKKTNDQ